MSYSQYRSRNTIDWKQALSTFVLCWLVVAWLALAWRTCHYAWLGIYGEQNYRQLSESCMNLPSYNALNYGAMGPEDRKLFGARPPQ